MAKLDGKNVLVVEDDYLIAIGISQSFEEAGADVIGPVGRVDKALALIAQCGRIDGAVLDINLNDEMVFPVAEALCERGVPFLFSTGYDASIIPERFHDVPRFLKPVLPGTVREALFS